MGRENPIKYHLIIADRLINPGQLSRVVGSVSRNVGFGSGADLLAAARCRPLRARSGHSLQRLSPAFSAIESDARATYDAPDSILRVPLLSRPGVRAPLRAGTLPLGVLKPVQPQAHAIREGIP
jgi:hypothetical protein